MESWKSKALHVVLFAFVIVMFLLGYGATRERDEKNNIIELSEGWKVKINDETYEDISLRDFRFPIANRGDWIVLSTTLPENLSDGLNMSLHMVYSVAQVYIDGSKIYEYGMSDYEDEKFIGYGTAFIDLPEGCAGKELKITLFVTEDNSFSSINVPEIYSASTALVSYYSTRLAPLAVALTLIVAGLAISLVTFCLYFKSYSMERLFCVGVFAICIGLWSLCNYNLIDVFSNNLRIKTYYEFFSLYLLTFPLLLYFREDVESRQARWESFIYYALLFVEMIMFTLVMVTQVTNKVHLVSYLRFFHVFIAISAVFIVCLVVRGSIRDKSHKVLTVAFCILIAIGMRDLIIFNLLKYNDNFATEQSYKSYIAAGALIFVVAMLADFIMEMRKKMYATAQTQFLEKIAYVDVLTDLYTRRKCDDIFNWLDTQNDPYTLIQFDLNNLKQTNDVYGHDEGDELIRRFANALKKTFTDGEALGRMGGDEFVAIILERSGKCDPEEKIRLLKEHIEEDNAEYDGVEMSTSAGYCKSTEVENPTALAVYKEADKRMYKDKEEFYKRIGYRRRRSDAE